MERLTGDVLHHDKIHTLLLRQFVEALGKGGSARIHAEIFDEAGVVPVDSRTAAGSQELQLYDVVRIAHHFGISVLAALYRLRNLRLMSEPEFQGLKRQDEEGASQGLAAMLALPEIQPNDQAGEFCRRSLVLALEAFRQDKNYTPAATALHRIEGYFN